MTSTVIQPRPIPALPKLPLIGNLIAFRRNPLALYARMQHECGDIAIYHLGTQPVVMLFAPEYIGTILVERDYESFEKSPALRRVLAPLLGQGILTTDRESHRRQRKILAPAFQHRQIATYAPAMISYAERIQQEWQNGQTINVAHQMMRITLGIVGEALFGVDVLDEAPDLGNALTVVLHSANARIASFIPLPLSWPTPNNQRFKQALARLDTTVYRIISERRRLGASRNDLLSILLHTDGEGQEAEVADSYMRDEVMTLFLAGHETTANALTWTWHLLTQHPAIYARVQEEVDRVLAGRSPTVDDLENLPYTLQVFKETLRLYPPVHAIARQTVQPVNLGNHQLPIGTIIGISTYLLHRNLTYFPEPERFDPDRWTPENEAKLPRYAYLPFSAGPRNCLGAHFAMQEAQLILAMLVQHVTFELVPGQQIEPEPLITLRPRNGIKMAVQRRR